MRRALERLAWRMWRGEAGFGGKVLQLLLVPLGGVWRLATLARNRRHDRSAPGGVEGLRVVSVGNLAVGGTGKTPVAAWVAASLREMGARPVLLLRGYGEDEVALHGRWNPDIPVEVGSDRVEAARRGQVAGADVAVLDDGFQHRGLARDLDVVLLAVEDPLPGPVLPRGPYREPMGALRRADVVVLTRRSGSTEDATARAATLRGAGVLSDDACVACLRLETDTVTALGDFGKGRKTAPGRGRWADGAVALTAIARPHAFQAAVEELADAPVELLAYPDHHDYSVEDVRSARRRAGARPIFVTEKDAVKLVDRADGLGEAWVVGQRLAWDWGRDDVVRRLAAVVGSREEAVE